METLVGLDRLKDARIIRSAIEKRIAVDSLMPEAFEKLPWSGHLGVQLLDQVVDIIRGHASTLVFTNTRSQSEIWYQKILAANPDLAGAIALHHGSISKELRFWVEDALYDGRLKAVVCTSSLDLGVDFRPVEAIVQIGGPKGWPASCSARAGADTNRVRKARSISCPRSGWSSWRRRPSARRWKRVKSSRDDP